MGTKPSRNGYLPINGLNLYYEVYGELGTSKPPLLLIPGAFMATDSMTAWTDAFAQERAVIVFDQQGHGRTPDTSREMSYEQFADDAAALLRALEVERADVMGYSQGGGVALQLAIRHPVAREQVGLDVGHLPQGRLVSVGVRSASGASAPEAFAGTPVEKAFKEHTPDAEAFDAYLEKMKALNINDQDISDDEMRSISAKTMVIVGDADGVTLEHALAMFKLRGGGDEEAAASGVLQKVPAARLVVLPAMSHIGLSGESELLVPMVSAFLDDVPPTTPELF